MDEKAVNAKGIAPLKPELDRVAAVKDKGALIDEMAHLHLIGASSLFNFYSNSDLHDCRSGDRLHRSGRPVAARPRLLHQRRHPDEGDAATSRRLRDAKMFTLAGQTPQQAADSAQTVLRIETALAKASMDRTERRDPKNRDHKMSRDEALALAPTFYLNRLFHRVGAPNFTRTQRRQSRFLQAGERRSRIRIAGFAEDLCELACAAGICAVAFAAIRRRQLQNAAGSYRAKRNPGALEALRQPHRRLSGRGSGAEICGSHTFGADGKQRMLKMVDALEKSLDEDIQILPG